MPNGYPSDLTDREWEVLREYIPPTHGGRHRTVDLRGIVDGVRYVLKTGCQWRMLPHEYPPWQTIYYYFDKWKRDGTIEKMHDALVKIVRVQSGKKTLSNGRYIGQSVGKDNRMRQRNKL